MNPDSPSKNYKGLRSYKSTVYFYRHASMFLAGIQMIEWIPAKSMPE